MILIIYFILRFIIIKNMRKYRLHLFLLIAGLTGGCCTPQPYQRLYILAEESKIQREIDATSCSVPEPSMARSSEIVPPAFPIAP